MAQKKTTTRKRTTSKSSKKSTPSKPPKPSYADIHALRVAWEQAQERVAYALRRYRRALAIDSSLRAREAEVDAASVLLHDARRANADAYAAFLAAREEANK